jgi:hypothetical protein
MAIPFSVVVDLSLWDQDEFVATIPVVLDPPTRQL